MTKTKLKDLLSEVFDETPKVDRHKVSEGVRNFGIVGKTLYNNSNIMEVATQLAEIAEQAHHSHPQLNVFTLIQSGVILRCVLKSL